jgi:hypothetical protein
MKILILQQSLKADEFFECISKILGFHLLAASIEDFLGKILKIALTGYVVYHGVSKFKECLEGLYGT